MPIAPRPFIPRLTDVEKGKILVFHKLSFSNVDVAHGIGRTESAVRKFVARHNTHRSDETHHSSSRPPFLDQRVKRLLVRKTKNDWRQFLAELRDKNAPGVSVRNIKHVLKESNVKKRRAKKRALLTEEHASKRLTWVKKYKDWDEGDWEGVLFSDECSVEKSKDSCTVWVFGTPRRSSTRMLLMEF